MRAIDLVIVIGWLAFWAYWLVEARNVKAGQKGGWCRRGASCQIGSKYGRRRPGQKGGSEHRQELGQKSSRESLQRPCKGG